MNTTSPNRYKPDERECALLLLHLLEVRALERGKALTRVRLAEVTLKRLWNRQRLDEQVLNQIQEWLLTAGWALIFAGSTYAAVRIDAVENWPRISSKRLAQEIQEVAAGQYDFGQLEHLMVAEAASAITDKTDGPEDE